MKITYGGHATFLIETKGKKLLFDPFISGAGMLDLEQFPQLSPEAISADYILVSHGHMDHVGDVEAIGKRTGARLISNFEIVSWFENKGLSGHPMNHGGQWSFDFGQAKYVNAVHSSVLPDGTYGGNPGGFVVSNDEGTFYFAGDTALTMDMQLLPLTCPPLDFAILPIGDNFTMGYQDAIIASDWIKCDRIIGCHYDTFGYIKIDHAAAQKAFADKGKELILIPVGETIEL
ncbi:MAG: metal-dependent hydrolase [Lewinellaceae bacterium]|nr:metal-dependent hydrolase [Lewinellaceae bacterium]